MSAAGRSEYYILSELENKQFSTWLRASFVGKRGYMWPLPDSFADVPAEAGVYKWISISFINFKRHYKLASKWTWPDVLVHYHTRRGDFHTQHFGRNSEKLDITFDQGHHSEEPVTRAVWQEHKEGSAALETSFNAYLNREMHHILTRKYVFGHITMATKEKEETLVANGTIKMCLMSPQETATGTHGQIWCYS